MLSCRLYTRNAGIVRPKPPIRRRMDIESPMSDIRGITVAAPVVRSHIELPSHINNVCKHYIADIIYNCDRLRPTTARLHQLSHTCRSPVITYPYRGHHHIARGCVLTYRHLVQLVSVIDLIIADRHILQQGIGHREVAPKTLCAFYYWHSCHHIVFHRPHPSTKIAVVAKYLHVVHVAKRGTGRYLIGEVS